MYLLIYPQDEMRIDNQLVFHALDLWKDIIIYYEIPNYIYNKYYFLYFTLIDTIYIICT